jgi:hypothetical protein
MSRLTCELMADPELMRIAEQALHEVLAEETERVEAEKRRLLASRSRFDRRRAATLHPEITVEMVADRIAELTKVRNRLRRAEAELQRLRTALRAVETP